MHQHPFAFLCSSYRVEELLFIKCLVYTAATGLHSSHRFTRLACFLQPESERSPLNTNDLLSLEMLTIVATCVWGLVLSASLEDWCHSCKHCQYTYDDDAMARSVRLPLSTRLICAHSMLRVSGLSGLSCCRW